MHGIKILRHTDIIIFLMIDRIIDRYMLFIVSSQNWGISFQIWRYSNIDLISLVVNCPFEIGQIANIIYMTSQRLGE